jgi:hypothetical protein
MNTVTNMKVWIADPLTRAAKPMHKSDPDGKEYFELEKNEEFVVIVDMSLIRSDEFLYGRATLDGTVVGSFIHKPHSLRFTWMFGPPSGKGHERVAFRFSSDNDSEQEMRASQSHQTSERGKLHVTFHTATVYEPEFVRQNDTAWRPNSITGAEKKDDGMHAAPSNTAIPFTTSQYRLRRTHALIAEREIYLASDFQLVVKGVKTVKIDKREETFKEMLGPIRRRRQVQKQFKEQGKSKLNPVCLD